MGIVLGLSLEYLWRFEASLGSLLGFPWRFGVSLEFLWGPGTFLLWLGLCYIPLLQSLSFLSRSLGFNAAVVLFDFLIWLLGADGGHSKHFKNPLLPSIDAQSIGKICLSFGLL